MPKRTLATIDNMPFKTISDYSMAIDALKAVRDDAKAGRLDMQWLGICAQWSNRLVKTYNWEPIWHFHTVDAVAKIAANWPGTQHPGVESCEPISNLNVHENLWTGIGLQERLSLIEYMLGRLRSFRQQLQRINTKESS